MDGFDALVPVANSAGQAAAARHRARRAALMAEMDKVLGVLPPACAADLRGHQRPGGGRDQPQTWRRKPCGRRPGAERRAGSGGRARHAAEPEPSPWSRPTAPLADGAGARPFPRALVGGEGQAAIARPSRDAGRPACWRGDRRPIAGLGSGKPVGAYRHRPPRRLTTVSVSAPGSPSDLGAIRTICSNSSAPAGWPG